MDDIDWYDSTFKSINNEIKDKNFLDLCNFYRIKNYKSQTKSMAKEEKIKCKTKEAFEKAEDNNTEEAINILIDLPGVGISTASAILAMKYPDKYPIIDKNVLKALGKDEWKNDYTKDPKIYVKYRNLLKEKVKDRNICLREKEFQLFKEGRNK